MIKHNATTYQLVELNMPLSISVEGRQPSSEIHEATLEALQSYRRMCSWLMVHLVARLH